MQDDDFYTFYPAAPFIAIAMIASMWPWFPLMLLEELSRESPKRNNVVRIPRKR